MDVKARTTFFWQGYICLRLFPVRAVIAGFGYLGQKIAAGLATQGFNLTVIRRSPSPGQNGIKFVPTDLMANLPEMTESAFDVAVFCLAPGSRNPELYQQAYVVAQKNFLARIEARHYVYISSTAVYPDLPGTYTEEHGSAHSDRAAILLEAEATARSHSRAIALRLAGLYSQERPIYGRMKSNYKEDRLVHFIHRDDAARAVLHSIQEKLTGIFNVHDGHPQWRSTILRELGITTPAQAGPQRHISQQKFADTGFRPVYQDYLTGICNQGISD